MLHPERFLSKPYLASRAAQTLRRYFRRKPPPRLPIDIEDLAESLFDLYIVWRVIPEGEDGLTLGGVRPERNELVLNERARGFFDEFPGSENYTKAHEVAHWILHIQEPPAAIELFADADPTPAIVCMSKDLKPPRETQADICASYLLMPEDLFLAECDRRDLSEWQGVYDLRAFLGVSISAVCNRLQDLRVIRISAERKVELLRKG